MSYSNPNIVNVVVEEQENTTYSNVVPPTLEQPTISSYQQVKYYPPAPIPQYQPVLVVPSVFPPMETPNGPLISVYLEDNSHHQKRNRRLGGAGVTAVACAASGGLVLLPILAGVAVNKIVKKTKEKCVYAYHNTFVYELRSALARGLGVPPELLQLKRKGVMLDDCTQLSRYMEYPGKNRIHITMHIKGIPVVGSVCQYEGQYRYPDPQFVDCSSYQFIDLIGEQISRACLNFWNGKCIDLSFGDLISCYIYAIIIGPRNKYPDYGVQSESCRMYKDLVAGGVKQENIILMSTKRVSYHRWNPWPGQLFTDDSPDAPGKDYHHGCIENIDYEEEDMRGPVLLAIMRGDIEQARNLTGKKDPHVLRSTDKDDVMFYLTSHGGPGSIAVGNTSVHEEDFISTIKYMYENKMYKRFFVLLEACYSGSMFVNLPKDINVYAIASTDPEHESWESHCPPDDDIVNGKKMGACLSCYWDNSMEWYMEGGSHHTLDELHEHSHAFVAEHSDQNTSHWGDIEGMGKLPISEFMGEVPFNPTRKSSDHSTIVPKSEVPLHLAKWRAIRADKKEYTLVMYDYEAEVYWSAKKEIEVMRLATSVMSEKEAANALQTHTDKYNVTCVRQLMMDLMEQCDHSYPFSQSTINVLKHVCHLRNTTPTINYDNVCL